jgi:hypothetical protein
MKLTKIFDGTDRAREEEVADFPTLIRHYINLQRKYLGSSLKMSRAVLRHSVVREWDGNTESDKSLNAYINGARWLVNCWCGNIEYASREHDFIFCHACGDVSKVVFPESMQVVEKDALSLAPDLDFEITNSQLAAKYCPLVSWEPA